MQVTMAIDYSPWLATVEPHTNRPSPFTVRSMVIHPPSPSTTLSALAMLTAEHPAAALCLDCAAEHARGSGGCG